MRRYLFLLLCAGFGLATGASPASTHVGSAAPAEVADRSGEFAYSSACNTIRLGGRPHVFYREGVSCRFGKRWVYRLYGTRGRKRPRGWRCTSGSGYRQGGGCYDRRDRSRFFGWHPYD